MSKKIVIGIAQAMLITMIIPMVAVVVELLMPGEIEDFGNSIVTSLPMFDVWYLLLASFIELGEIGLEIKALSGAIWGLYIDAFFEATIIGICVSAAKKIHEFLIEYNLAYVGETFLKFLGLIGGLVLCSLIDSDGGIAGVTMGFIVLYVLIYALAFFTPIPNIFSITDILSALLNGLVSVILVGYITVFYLAMNQIGSGMLVLEMAIIAFVSLAILFVIDGTLDKVKTVLKILRDKLFNK